MEAQKTDPIARLEKRGLARKLRIADLFAVGYGDLGSSIYYALGITAFFALGAAPLSLLLAGIVFVCTSLTYAEMTSTLKASGGSASFARAAFNDLVSFIAGWGLLLDFIVTVAISIFSVAPYLTFIYQGFAEPFIHLSFSIGLITILYLMNYFGVEHSTRISIALTGAALCTQCLILIFALFSGADLSITFDHLQIGAKESWSPSWGGFWRGTAMAMVAYTGIESIAALGAETRRPIRTLPRAVIAVMSVLLFMYLGLSIVGLSVMTPQELGTKYVNDPLAGIVAQLPIGGHLLGPWVGLLGALLLFVAGNAGLMGASRLSFNMGEFYQLPRFFYHTHPKHKTPFVSLGFFSILAIIVLIWSRGQLHFLADLYNFGAMLAFFFAHLSLIMLRIKQPNLKRAFRAPLNIRFSDTVSIPLTAIIGALATASVWILVVITKPDGRYLGFSWMLFGVAMYFFYRKRKRIAPISQVQIEKIKVPGYKPLVIQNILVPTRGGDETETVQMACALAKLHKARLSAIHLIKVPHSLPIDAAMPDRELEAKAILQRARAIAEEFGLEMDVELVKTRQIDEAILQQVAAKQIDLLILGTLRPKEGGSASFGALTERMIKQALCRTLIVS